MNAQVYRLAAPTEPCRWEIPEAAWRRLRLRLGRGAATGESLAASLAYGVPIEALDQLLQLWLDDFELESSSLLGLPGFATELDGAAWRFVHVRSTETFAVPLLLLHGYSGSPAELSAIIAPLAEPRADGADSSDAFHVVCPALPGFGGTDAAPSARAVAEGCAALMHRLGYARYAVHGSDLGANLALELAALDGAHIAGLHVTALPSYPAETASDMASLARDEKSQLALLSALRDEPSFQLPESPIQALAFALTQLQDSEDEPSYAWASSLLASLSWSWALGDSRARNELYRELRLASARPTTVPIAVHTFPLDAPSLRRFAELAHRVVEWTDHERGGSLPALEQPDLLKKSLRDFFRRFR